MNRLKGKWVVVTGASSGIGEGCARRFAASDANLILVARRGDRLKALKKMLERDHNIDVCMRWT
jgi:short-subunit dehydrogenase